MRKVEFNFEAIKEFQNQQDINFTDKSMAKMMNISKSHFSRVMSGKRKPGLNFIMGAIRAGIAPQDLFIISNSDT